MVCADLAYQCIHLSTNTVKQLIYVKQIELSADIE